MWRVAVLIHLAVRETDFVRWEKNRGAILAPPQKTTFRC
jgi:hypothetical protein